MSTLTLRYHATALSFIPHRRDREVSKAVRQLRVRISRRRFKQALRSAISK